MAQEATVAHKSNGHEEEKEPRRIDVDFHGDRFQIPQDMEMDEAINALTRYRDEQKTAITISESVRAFPLDGAVAFQKALKERYGWTTLTPSFGFWGKKINPTMIGVEVALNETIQVPWGRCQVPKIDGELITDWGEDDEIPVFILKANVLVKDKKALAEIAASVRKFVATESIYRGQAIKINFRDGDGDRKTFDPAFSPKFLDLNKYAKQKIVYAEVTERMIRTNLFNPVIYTERCRAQKIPLKRGVLLEGRYGTGKTLTAHSLAKACVEHGWTFLYVQDVRDLDLAMKFARMYSPCVLFAEDVDRMIPATERTPDTDRVLNTLDGVESKNVEIMTVLTTNNVGNIHPAFLRPGRIDTVIKIAPPDDKAMVALVREYGRNLKGESIIDADDQRIMTAVRGLSNTNASFVQEAVERAKLSAIGNCEGDLKITGDDIEIAVESLKSHLEMVCPDAGIPDDCEETVIDPMKMAFHCLLDQFAFHILQKIVNPKTLEKIVVKTAKKMGRPRGGGSFNPN
jgi:ATP-dependent 26S proteasome regulatory subunit